MAFKKVESNAVTVGTEAGNVGSVTGYLVGFRAIDGGHGARPQPVLAIDGSPILVFCGADAVSKMLPIRRGTLVRITADLDENKAHRRVTLTGGRTMKSYTVEQDDTDSISIPDEWKDAERPE